MKTRLKILLSILLLAILYSIYYWVIPAVVDISSSVPKIKQLVKKEMGFEIDIQNPHFKMGLSPSIWLKASSLEILDNGGPNPLAVTNPKLKIKLFPLFVGKIQVAYLSCDKISADFKLDNRGRFYVGNHLVVFNSNPKLSLEDSIMNLKNYSLHFDDELNSKKLFLEGDYFKLLKYNSKKHVEFSTDSKLSVNNHNSFIKANVEFRLPLKKSFDKDNINFTGTVTNLNLADFSPYIKILTNNKIQKTSGIFNAVTKTNFLDSKTDRIISQIIIDDLNISGKDKPSSICFKDKLKIFTVLDVSKNKLKIQKLNILSKRMNTKISGKITKISSKNPILDLSAIVTKSRIEDFIALIPATKASTEDVNFVALKKYGYYSDLDGHVSIKGKSDAPILTGEFVSTNGYVVKPLPDYIHKAKATITFWDKMMGMDIFVPIGVKENIRIKGSVEMTDKKRSSLDILSTPNIDLETAQTVLIPLREIFNLELGPIPVMKLDGTGNINLKIRGSKTEPHLFGELNFKNADASFNDIDMQLEKISGSLLFDDTNTHFVTNAGSFKNKMIKVDGKCSLMGILDYNIIANGQDLNDLLNILKKSPMLSSVKELVSPIQTTKGKSNFTLKLAGKVTGINKFDFGKNILVTGNIKLLGNNILLNNLPAPIENVCGDIKFKNTDLDLNLYSFIDKSKVNFTGKIKGNDANLKFYGAIKNNSFNASADIKNIMKANPIVNGNFIADNFDISVIKNLDQCPYISNSAKKQIGQISNPSGKVNLRAYVKNNVLSSKIKLNDISLAYSANNIPIKMFSGAAELKGDKLILYKVNAAIESMPILVDGIISNIFKDPYFNVYINSKPTQKFIETYINKNAIYPLKIKGDINYSSRITGTKDFFKARTEINLQEDSNIYYMGSTLGDLHNPIRIFLNANVAKNVINVVDFQYDKLISSQNNREFVSPQLNAKGYIRVEGKDIYLYNFKIKTQNPTDAKIFNILFKKPMIKQGLFTSNVSINNAISNPHMIGDVNFTGINIPLLDTTIKDVSLDFNDKNINIKSTGEILSNKIVASAIMQNRLNPPFIFDNIDIYFENLDINTIIKSLENLEFEADKSKVSNQKQELDLTNIIIKDAKLKADNIAVKNIYAKNLLAKISLNEKLLFSMDNFQFEVAEGRVNGTFNYNLLNSATKLDLNMNNVNANLMAEALFDLPSQMFGSLRGTANLTCNGKNHKTCMDTLSGKGGFEVADGRMPKLGSLEYLLKASNLVKGGLTGLSINGLIDLVTPLKTGQFESIRGDFYIKSGVAESINIFSKGKDLSMFLTGTYNFSTLIADFDVLGRLSKKISTVFGPIGNASLNTLFNTIPGLHLDATDNAEIIKNINKIPGFELNDKLYRIFSVKIYGDINGENYVQSFKWVE